jgi:ribonuclease VapC
MFVDASAIVSILTNEEDAAPLAAAVEEAESPITSPIAMFEATLGIRNRFRIPVERAEWDLARFLPLAGIEVVPITAKDAKTAIAAFKQYGKGQGHPAQLNLGDCFAYAVAKNHQTSLLFNVEKFAHTDAKLA